MSFFHSRYVACSRKPSPVGAPPASRNGTTTVWHVPQTSLDRIWSEYTGV